MAAATSEEKFRPFDQSGHVAALFCAGRDFQKVVAELSLHRTVNNVQSFVKHNSVEFRNHLTGTECSQSTALGTRWALTVFFGNITKIGAAFDLSFKLKTSGFFGNKNVTSGSTGHGITF